MRIIGIIFLLFLAIVTMLHILGSKLNKGYIELNAKLMKQNDLFKKTLLSIKSELRLTTLKDCPDEEKETIVKEVIDFIEEVEKVW